MQLLRPPSPTPLKHCQSSVSRNSYFVSRNITVLMVCRAYPFCQALYSSLQQMNIRNMVQYKHIISFYELAPWRIFASDKQTCCITLWPIRVFRENHVITKGQSQTTITMCVFSFFIIQRFETLCLEVLQLFLQLILCSFVLGSQEV